MIIFWLNSINTKKFQDKSITLNTYQNFSFSEKFRNGTSVLPVHKIIHVRYLMSFSFYQPTIKFVENDK